MIPKKERYLFPKVNGKKSNGKHLEILVNGSIVEKLLIQPNIGIGEQTYVRIIGSNLFDEDIAYKLKDPEDYTKIIREIEKTAEVKYSNLRGVRRFLLRKPKIEIRIQ